jgi:hypothetical protein
MDKWWTLHSLHDAPSATRLRSATLLVAIVAAAIGPVLAVAAIAPRTVVLPVLCLVALAISGLAVLFAWARPRGNNTTMWDIAGALALVGCAAAVLSEPMQVVQLFGSMTPR